MPKYKSEYPYFKEMEKSFMQEKRELIRYYQSIVNEQAEVICRLNNRISELTKELELKDEESEED